MVSINKKDSEWLLGPFKENTYGKFMRGNIVHEYLYAEKILKGLPKIQHRQCGCEYAGIKRNIDQLYKEFLNEQENNPGPQPGDGSPLPQAYKKET